MGNIEITKNYLVIILTSITILSIFASSVISFTFTDNTVKRHEEEIKQLKVDSIECKLISVQIPLIAEDVREIKQDIKHLMLRGD